jgi:hypothetical protein
MLDADAEDITYETPLEFLNYSDHPNPALGPPSDDDELLIMDYILSGVVDDTSANQDFG